ncbi:uncharacterized protein LOC118801870 isoform X2 [Colossoma macropomum]|nr:uncharacterized protein LOC118801870 isoform X2 [Colossoma macropomum]XP_036418157.1 uncharacterized protein LOC118801870 isoform X2 [Colossoma macropomum]
MQESEAWRFLETHQSTIVQRVRDVDSLADVLSQPSFSEPSVLSQEMASKIRTQKTRVDKMREVYEHLNSNRGFELTLKWLQDNEPDLIEELEKSSETDGGAPARKRCRRSAEAVDQTDSGLGTPNLKTLFTFAKLEKWVSALENSQNLVDELKNKLADGQMEALKENLKDKKLKKSFCFSINEVKKIESNQKLKRFFQSQGVDFPNLAVDLFFERDTELRPQNVQKQAKKPQRKPPKSDGEDDAPPEGITVDMQQIVSEPNKEVDLGQGNSEPYEAENRKDWAAEKDKTTQELNNQATEKDKTQELKESKMNEHYRLLCEWVKEKCHNEGEAKEMFDCISIENQVEHSEYPCFIAEKVMMHTDPQTEVKQIIVLDKKNEAAKKNLLKDTRILLNYQMWVCGVKKAVLINQKERVINYDPSFEATIKLCERLVFEVFAPTLVLFKNMQREKFTKTTKDFYCSEVMYSQPE